MAFPTAFPETPAEALATKGFLSIKDVRIGNDVLEMERRSFAYYSEFGLDFCKRNVLNEHMRSIIETFFDGKVCLLGHWLRYKAYPGHIVCFRKGGPRAGRRRLVVHLLPQGTRISYWSYSHKHDLPTSDGSRLLYELSEPELIEAGCERVEDEFPDGGLVVFDGRVGFELMKGYAITFEFATVDIVERWPKLIFPNLPGLAERVAEMETSKIGLNFGFEDIGRSVEA